MGTIAHDIIQGYYEGQFKSHNEMVDEFDKKIEEWRKDNRGFKFPSKSDAELYVRVAWARFISRGELKI